MVSFLGSLLVIILELLAVLHLILWMDKVAIVKLPRVCRKHRLWHVLLGVRLLYVDVNVNAFILLCLLSPVIVKSFLLLLLFLIVTRSELLLTSIVSMILLHFILIVCCFFLRVTNTCLLQATHVEFGVLFC